MALHVFPPTVTQPRKSSLKKSKSHDVSVAGSELKGVAFQVSSAPKSTGVVRPGNEQIKHSLFCEPPATTELTRHGSLQRPQRSRKRFSANFDNISIRADNPMAENEDELSALPENSNFGSPSSQTRLKPGLERPKLPLNISTEVQPDTETLASPGGDGLSPLPTKTRFTPISPAKSEFPSRSVISNSPTLVHGESPASMAPPYSPGEALQSFSLFPKYDHSKPLNEQSYYPNSRPQALYFPKEKISKFDSSPIDKKQALQQLDLSLVKPTAMVVDGYEHIPIGIRSDLVAVCNASCGNFPVAGRKVLFRLLQPQGRGTSLAIGISPDSLLYSMDKDRVLNMNEKSNASDQLVISKHSPDSPSSCTVAQLALPNTSEPVKPGDDDVISIFPQLAAINAIDTIANSPVGSEIAKFDPSAASPEAARIAQDAVWEAHRRYRSLLVREKRKRDGMGSVTAAYKLEHPTLGSFAITVTKSSSARHTREPRAKISLHHPSATPAAINAETLVLAFLDFGKDACVLDIPGLLALEASYIIDTVICAILAVAVVENDALIAETMTFDAPPKSPLPIRKDSKVASDGGSTTTKRSSKLWKRNKKQKQKEPEDDLPALTQGALALLGLSFKMAIWTLEVSAKVGVGVILATSQAIKKA